MEHKLYDGPPPAYTTAEWYAGRERAAHLEQPDHRQRLLLTRDHVLDLAGQLRLKTVTDLGCGDGGLLSLLPELDAWGYDLCPAAVAGARDDRGVNASLVDVVAEPDAILWGDIAVATEFFEHLADPHAFAREIAKHSRVLVASSPATENDLVHYAYHAWAWDTDGYAALLDQAGFRVTRHERVSYYQVISGVRQ